MLGCLHKGHLCIQSADNSNILWIPESSSPVHTTGLCLGWSVDHTRTELPTS